jgi:hypothetical protein
LTTDTDGEHLTQAHHARDPHSEQGSNEANSNRSETSTAAEADN